MGFRSFCLVDFYFLCSGTLAIRGLFFFFFFFLFFLFSGDFFCFFLSSSFLWIVG